MLDIRGRHCSPSTSTRPKPARQPAAGNGPPPPGPTNRHRRWRVRCRKTGQTGLGGLPVVAIVNRNAHTRVRPSCAAITRPMPREAPVTSAIVEAARGATSCTIRCLDLRHLRFIGDAGLVYRFEKGFIPRGQCRGRFCRTRRRDSRWWALLGYIRVRANLCESFDHGDIGRHLAEGNILHATRVDDRNDR